MSGENSIQDASAKMEAFFFFWDKTSFSGKGKVEVDPVTNEQKVEILKLHKQGLGYKAIGRSLDIPVDNVKKFIKRLKYEDICICLECGSIFSPLPGKKIKRFCSKKCRLRYWQKKTRTSLKYKIQKACPECGAVFMTYKYRQGVFCSRECFQTHESRKWREANGKE
ncbi:MAG: hypothetical protein MR990_01520 [Mollicutes bacterium]|nr:hypothetical protein [Mollicutes bacterium]